MLLLKTFPKISHNFLPNRGCSSRLCSLWRWPCLIPTLVCLLTASQLLQIQIQVYCKCSIHMSPHFSSGQSYNHDNHDENEPRSPLCPRPGPLAPNHEPCAWRRPGAIIIIMVVVELLIMIIVIMMEMLIMVTEMIIMMMKR